jgi:hypothetical protein
METAPSKLNEGQTLASVGFFEFLFSDEKELNISGPGGVGKTFLMGHMIDEIMPQYEGACELAGIKPLYRGVIMTATTNKAAEVLHLSTGRSVSTVHSFFNLKVTDDYATGRQEITKTKQWMVHENLIIFIDECSMIDKSLRKFIREGTLNCKVVFVGDHCQLAPVKEKISVIYTEGIKFYELTEPMRTNVPALHELNKQFRRTVETGEFTGIQLVPGIIDHLTDEEFEAEIIANFADPGHNNRIITYTNQRVLDYNAFIRQVRNLPEDFQKGEWLISNNALQVKGGRLSVEEEVRIFDLDRTSSMDEIDDNVELEVRFATLENKLGELYAGIPVPVDRDHFDKLIKYYAKMRNWNRYFYLKNTYPDLRQRDACTSYKAQGSSHDTVYIDLSDISTCRDPEQAARLIYVAVSRARVRVALHGELVSKFGWIIPAE